MTQTTTTTATHVREVRTVSGFHTCGTCGKSLVPQMLQVVSEAFRQETDGKAAWRVVSFHCLDHSLPYPNFQGQTPMLPEECPYCGGNCPNEPDDSPNLCDGFAGDIDGLVAMSKLPEYCYALLPSNQMLIRIDRGRKGYSPCRLDGQHVYGEKAQEVMDKMNADLNVTSHQRSAMLHGSMFGWEAPAADPDHVLNQGQ